MGIHRPSRRPILPLCASAFAIAALAAQARAQAPAYADHADLLMVRNAEGRERPVESVADWEARRGHVLEHLQEVMGPLPGPERLAPLDVKVLSETREPGYTRRKIEFQAEPGDRVPAWLLIPDGPPAKRPAMLCLHQTIKIGKDEPAGLGGGEGRHYAKDLALRGYVAIVPDYPNFGDYKCDPYAMGYASASMKGIWNHKRAVDVLASLPEVDPERIGAIGHSLGGHNAIFVALFEPRIKAVVSSCGFNAFPYYYKGDVKGWSHKGYMPRLKDVYDLDLKKIPFDWPELIGALAPRPFFTNSPLHDANFEVEGVRVCVRAARPIYALYRAEDDLVADYPDAEHAFPAEARAKAYEFLDRKLKPAP